MDVERWLRQYNRPKKFTGEHNAISNIDIYDRQDIAAMLKQIKQFQAARNRLCDFVDSTGADLSDDILMSFFKVMPELTEAQKMDPRFALNHAVMQELMENCPEWERLRTWTQGDAINAPMSFVDVEPTVEELFDKGRKKVEQAQQQLQQLQEQLQQLQQQEHNLEELVEKWQQGGEMDPDGDAASGGQEALEALQGQIADMQAQVDAAQGQLDGQAQQAAKSGMPGMRDAMGQAADKQEKMAAACNSFGLDPGQLQRMPANERLKLAAKFDNNETFKRLAELIGPMMRIAQAEQTRKVYHSFEEVYDIETGMDLFRAVPSEMLDLLHPQAKLHFYQKWAEGKLLQYAMRGEEKVGKGGIIVAMDNSGSMGGDREVWAKAVGLALYAIARDQKRSFYGMHFGSARELKTFDFRDPAKVEFNQVIDYAEFFFGGGTDFMRPLTESLKLLQEEEKQKGFTEGDLVFITDGMCRVTDPWLEEFTKERERLGFKVWGIGVGLASRTNEPLHSICDGNVRTIQDLLSAEDVRSMFRDI